MHDNYLTFDHGQVRLGGYVVPGILRNHSVRGKVRYDEAEQDGLSGKVKTPLGWEDSDVTLAVELLTDKTSTCYDKLADLDRLFKGHDSDTNPKVYDVSNPHLVARSIERVVFDGLDSDETDQDDVILATLYFREHRPVIVAAEERSVGATGPGFSPFVYVRPRDTGLDDELAAGVGGR